MIGFTLKRAVFAVVLLFILYSIGYWTSKKFQSDKVRNYALLIVQLGGLISLVVLLFDVSSKEASRQGIEAKTFALQTENSFIELEEEFQKYYPYLAHLYSSMNPGLSVIQNIPLPAVEDETKDKTLEVHMANIIFQRIENVLLENMRADFSKGKHSEWLRTWRLWFQSPRLREIWEDSKNIFYAHETVDWIEKNLIGNIPSAVVPLIK